MQRRQPTEEIDEAKENYILYDTVTRLWHLRPAHARFVGVCLSVVRIIFTLFVPIESRAERGRRPA